MPTNHNPNKQSVASGSAVLPRGLRIMEAARYAGTTSWFIRTAIWEGRLAARKCGKVLIILRDDLDRFLESQQQVEPSGASWLASRRQKV
jgi:excisionase family DNA binding protein